MGKPLAGRRVVITRSPADNVSLVDALIPLGAEIIELPLVQVVEPADGGVALRAAVDQLDRYRYVVLTSVNGVRAVADALAGRPWPSGVSVVPVGPVTAEWAADVGMVVGRAPSAATVATLVEEFPRWTGAGVCQVLAPLAELAGDAVTQGLSDRGYQVDRCEAYRTVAPPAEVTEPGRALLRDGADAVLFFSPSAVDRFVDLVAAGSASTGAHGPAGIGAEESGSGSVRLAVCIGPSTAARAARHDRWHVVVAEPHTEGGVVDALLDHPR
ncbi:MAG: uroporphyrinogen-III synthase [Actinomycetota bacterium]